MTAQEGEGAGDQVENSKGRRKATSLTTHDSPAEVITSRITKAGFMKTILFSLVMESRHGIYVCPLTSETAHTK